MNFKESKQEVLGNVITVIEDEHVNEPSQFLFLEDVQEIIDALQKEYAPTIEMTKDQANYLKGLITDVNNEFRAEELPADGSIKMTDKMIELDDSYLPLRYLNAILHPETIKIVGDDNHEV